MQDAVRTQAYAKDFFVRFEVQVGRASTNSVEQHLVDEAHDRRVVGGLTCIIICRIIRHGLNIDPVQVDITEILQAGGRAFKKLVEGQPKLVVLDEDRLGRQPSTELNVCYSLLVGWVRHRHEQLVAALYQRQYAVLARQLFRHNIF